MKPLLKTISLFRLSAKHFELFIVGALEEHPKFHISRETCNACMVKTYYSSQVEFPDDVHYIAILWKAACFVK